MCGIAGVLNHSGAPVEISTLKRMSDAIEHRGPDDEGQFADGPAGLANRRLSIRDLSARGHMPMSNPSENLTITYNGELYNYRELRSELETLGYRFRSESDTEVVLAAYSQWGAESLTRFNGMFAYAIWDSRRQEVFLARDRFGVKPLYWAQCGDVLLFGSEVKAMLAHGALTAAVSPDHLLEYFTFQNIFTDGTLFKGVHMLPAGHYATVRMGSRGLSPIRYWDWNFQEPESPADDREYAEELERLFVQAVERQLVSDVPVGAHLSGGMDSGSITAVAANRLPWMRTFTVGFDMTSATGLEAGSDERARSEAMSYAFKTEHYEAVLKAGDMERCMPALVWHLEDPRVGQSYPNYYVSRLASKFVKVALAGSGGDELFGGYPWRYYRGVVNDDFDHYIEKYYTYWHRLVPNSRLRGFFSPEIWQEVGDLRTIDIFRNQFPRAEAPATPEDYVNASLYFEAKTFLHGLFVVEDKLSMAHSLESRVPFMDNDLVDFAMRVPVSLKLSSLDEVVRLDENEPGPKTEKYYEQTNDGKLILRRVMDDFIPRSISNAPKQGFSGPDSSWFRGDSLDYVKRALGPDAMLYEYLDPKGVAPLVDDHLSGRGNRRLLLWSLLTFEEWCRCFLR